MISRVNDGIKDRDNEENVLLQIQYILKIIWNYFIKRIIK